MKRGGLQLDPLAQLQILIMQKQLNILRQALKTRIKDFIAPIKSPKIILAHSDLVSLFNFAYEFKFNDLLEEKDRLFQFQQDDEATDDSNAINLVFLLHPIASAMRTIKSMIVRNETKNMTKKEYILCFIPKIDIICVQELERLNVKNKIQISGFDFGLIPFPNNLISLQLSPYCHEVDSVNCCVEGLLRLSKLTGQFQRIVGKGDRAQSVLNNFEKRSKQELSNVVERDDTFLVVIDRRIDLVTPLLTGHSYQALIDHFYGIHLGSIKIPQKLLGREGNKLEPYRLYNRDKIYEEIAHVDIIDNLRHLEKARRQIKEQVQIKKGKASSAKEYQEVTSVWGVKYEQANNHLSIINSILNVMSEQMHFRNLINIEMQLLETGKTDLQQLHYLTLSYPDDVLLKLICLFSQVFPTTNFYNRYEKEILEIMVGDYSSEHINSLYQLQKVGILKNSKLKNKWEQICQAYDLLPQQYHSYTKIFIKYSALSVRFIQMLIKGKLTPEASALLSRQNYLKGIEKEGKKIKQLYVFYLGGITYGQISCLKILQKELGIKINILTTSVMGGGEFIRRHIQVN